MKKHTSAPPPLHPPGPKFCVSWKPRPLFKISQSTAIAAKITGFGLGTRRTDCFILSFHLQVISIILKALFFSFASTNTKLFVFMLVPNPHWKVLSLDNAAEERVKKRYFRWSCPKKCLFLTTSGTTFQSILLPFAGKKCNKISFPFRDEAPLRWPEAAGKSRISCKSRANFC